MWIPVSNISIDISNHRYSSLGFHNFLITAIDHGILVVVIISSAFFLNISQRNGSNTDLNFFLAGILVYLVDTRENESQG
jgi:hypothetical protein